MWGSGCAAILHGGAQSEPVRLAGGRFPRGRFGDSERQTGTERQADTRFVRALRCLTLGIRVGSTNGKVRARRESSDLSRGVF